MCGRFYLDETDEAPEELLILMDRAQRYLRQRKLDTSLRHGEIRPGDHAAVIALNRSLQPSVFPMQWGFKMARQLLINARSETALQRPTFRQSMLERRCLIPASAYFEWDHREKPLVKYRFALPDQPVFYLAGLYRFEAASPLPVFTILTREAAPDIACFHDRMPVILSAADRSAWLDKTASPLMLLLLAQTDVGYQRI